MNVLRGLLEALMPKRNTARILEQATLGSVGSLLHPTLEDLAGTRLVSLLPYREQSVRALILEAKFHDTSPAFSLLGAVLATYVSEIATERAFEKMHTVLVPIPLSKERYRHRGYNQVERIAREALRTLPPSFFSVDTTLLQRVRNTTPQTTLDRTARQRNMIGAFQAVKPLSSKTLYILLDDVATTGATLSAGRAALLEAKATDIEVVALAH